MTEKFKFFLIETFNGFLLIAYEPGLKDCFLDLKDDVLKYFDASSSTIPIPFGLGSALIDLFKLAINGFFKVEDTLNDIVSPGRKDNLSEYPINEIFFIVMDHKPSQVDMLPNQKRILKLKPLKYMELKGVKHL